jgi:hypothetical protein
MSDNQTGSRRLVTDRALGLVPDCRPDLHDANRSLVVEEATIEI